MKLPIQTLSGSIVEADSVTDLGWNEYSSSRWYDVVIDGQLMKASRSAKSETGLPVLTEALSHREIDEIAKLGSKRGISAPNC